MNHILPSLRGALSSFVFILVAFSSVHAGEAPRSPSGKLLDDAVRIQNMEPGQRTEELRKICQARTMDLHAYALCRVLFTPRSGQKFRRPGYGASSFPGGTDYDSWPLEPITVYRGVPIVIVKTVVGAGALESCDEYLDYCLKYCEWTQVRYKSINEDSIRAIVSQFVENYRWPAALTDWDRAYLNSLTRQGKQASAGQPATRSESKSEGEDKPQPESEGRSR